MMQVAFTFDSHALRRTRYLQIIKHSRQPYAIPSDPLYTPVHQFISRYERRGYPFRLITLLHATAVKMFGRPRSQSQQVSHNLFASAGLYLALDTYHQDLAIRPHLGDFTSGFSHQFGVALSVMSMSEAFTISWDKFNPLEVKRKRVLDYEALLSGNQALLQVEAKGVTSVDSRNNARRDIAKKKRETPSIAQIEETSIPIVKVGIIVQAVCDRDERTSPRKKPRIPIIQGILEIVDPPPHTHPIGKNLLLAGMYRHYAGVAIFAGLFDIANELTERASALVKEHKRAFHPIDHHFHQSYHLPFSNRQFVGIQWRPSDLAGQDEDVWFYQAVDRKVIEGLITRDVFPTSHAYSSDMNDSIDQETMVDSLLPDGSYFGIGLRPLAGLTIINPHDPYIKPSQTIFS